MTEAEIKIQIKLVEKLLIKLNLTAKDRIFLEKYKEKLNGSIRKEGAN